MAVGSERRCEARGARGGGACACVKKIGSFSRDPCSPEGVIALEGVEESGDARDAAQLAAEVALAQPGE